jgi:hypothetical protein
VLGADEALTRGQRRAGLDAGAELSRAEDKRRGDGPDGRAPTSPPRAKAIAVRASP